MAVVISNLGNSDLLLNGLRPSREDKKDYPVMYELIRDGGEWTEITFPILDSIEQFLEENKEELSLLVLFYTKQQDVDFSPSDTYYVYKIIELYNERNELFKKYRPKIIGVEINQSPHLYDQVFPFYQTKIDKLYSVISDYVDVQNEQIYVSLTGGVPACNMGLFQAMHHSTSFRPSKTFIYSPEPAKGEAQPMAMPVNIDIYFTANELLNNLGQLMEGNHYQQVKLLLKDLNFIPNNYQDILLFLDALLLRQNTRYDKAEELMRNIDRKNNSLLRHTTFFKNCFKQIKVLNKGLKTHNEMNLNWTTDKSVHEILREHYWKLKNLYNLGQYNDWAIGLATYYENILRIKAYSEISMDKLRYRNISSERKNLLDKMHNLSKSYDYGGFSTDSFFNKEIPYPRRSTYQKIIYFYNNKSMLGEGSEWSTKLEALQEERNKVVHKFGGLTLGKINEIFNGSDWSFELRHVLKEEFDIQITENPLEAIHQEFIVWIRKVLHEKYKQINY